MGVHVHYLLFESGSYWLKCNKSPIMERIMVRGKEQDFWYIILVFNVSDEMYPKLNV